MDEEGGRIQGQFRYAGRAAEGIHSVFEDALPDGWGRQMMAVIHGLSRRQMRLPDLLPLMEYRALGALMFSDTPVIHEPPSSAKEAAMEMEKQWYAGMVSGFEQELAVRNDEHRQKLADVASSPGASGPSSCTRNRGSPLNKMHKRADSLALSAAGQGRVFQREGVPLRQGWPATG